jgi:hypothetical protein
LIPPIVLTGLKPGPDYPGTERVQHALDTHWLQVVELKDDTLARALSLELVQGEAAAIAATIEALVNTLSVQPVSLSVEGGQEALVTEALAEEVITAFD